MTDFNDVKPIKDRILVDPIEESDTLDSGIIIVRSEKVKPHMGKVISVGPMVKDVKAGDTVLYGPHNNYDLERCGIKTHLKMMKEEDIEGILE